MPSAAVSCAEDVATLGRRDTARRACRAPAARESSGAPGRCDKCAKSAPTLPEYTRRRSARMSAQTHAGAAGAGQARGEELCVHVGVGQAQVLEPQHLRHAAARRAPADRDPPSGDRAGCRPGSGGQPPPAFHPPHPRDGPGKTPARPDPSAAGWPLCPPAAVPPGRLRPCWQKIAASYPAPNPAPAERLRRDPPRTAHWRRTVAKTGNNP